MQSGCADLGAKEGNWGEAPEDISSDQWGHRGTPSTLPPARDHTALATSLREAGTGSLLLSQAHFL